MGLDVLIVCYAAICFMLNKVFSVCNYEVYAFSFIRLKLCLHFNAFYTTVCILLVLSRNSKLFYAPPAPLLQRMAFLHCLFIFLSVYLRQIVSQS